MHCQYTYDVMKIMSDIRAEWGMKYPEEEKQICMFTVIVIL